MTLLLIFQFFEVPLIFNHLERFFVLFKKDVHVCSCFCCAFSRLFMRVLESLVLMLIAIAKKKLTKVGEVGKNLFVQFLREENG